MGLWLSQFGQQNNGGFNLLIMWQYGEVVFDNVPPVASRCGKKKNDVKKNGCFADWEEGGMGGGDRMYVLL